MVRVVVRTFESAALAEGPIWRYHRDSDSGIALVKFLLLKPTIEHKVKFGLCLGMTDTQLGVEPVCMLNKDLHHCLLVYDSVYHKPV